MASYINSGKLFVMFVCLQSSAFFAGAHQVRATPREGGKVTVEFLPDDGAPTSFQDVDLDDVFKNYNEYDSKGLASVNGDDFCFGVSRISAPNGLGYLMARNKCSVSTTSCQGVAAYSATQTDVVTCDFHLGPCSLFTRMHCDH